MKPTPSRRIAPSRFAPGRFAPSRFAPAYAIFATLALVAALAVPRASAADCTELCDKTLGFQSYGTGAHDSVCMQQCRGEAETCHREWGSLFECLDGERSAEDCRGAFEEAKSCSACLTGDVDKEGVDELIFVDDATCPAIGTGSSSNPFCRFHDGIDAALNTQHKGYDTKLVVCPGEYREGQKVLPIQAPGGPGRVIVESVIANEAVITGSKDWSGMWEPVTLETSTVVYNDLVDSEDLTQPSWSYVGAAGTPLVISDPPTAMPQVPTLVTEVSAVAGVQPFIEQNGLSIDDRLVTLSVYIRPNTASKFLLEIMRSHALGGQSAYYGFELPPGASCEYEFANNLLSGYGIEDAGNGWFRVYATRTVDSPAPLSPPQVVDAVRIALVEPTPGASAEFFAPQLDHKPLDRFSVTPRTYLPTLSQPTSKTELMQQTFYLAENWTHDWGLTWHNPAWGDLPPIVRRAEMIFFDGDRLRQELHLADMKPGSFLIDDGIVYGGYNHKANHSQVVGNCSPSMPCAVYVLPPSGVDLNDGKVEVAEEGHLLSLASSQRTELRGLRFQHATAAFDTASKFNCGSDPITCPSSLNAPSVGFTNASHLTLLENRFVHNNSVGFTASGMGSVVESHMLLENNMSTDNGIFGAAVRDARVFTVTGDNLSHNNWRGERGLIVGNSTGGAKYSGLSDGIVSDLTVSENFGNGLWFDSGSQGVQVLESRFSNNLKAALFFEANALWTNPLPNPWSYIVGNRFEGNETGFQVNGSHNIRVDTNTFEDNDSAISLNGNVYLPNKWLRDLAFTYNTVDATCPGQLWFRYGDDAWKNGDYSVWQPVMESLLSDYNDYSHVSGPLAEGFLLTTVPLTLSDWQGCTTEPWCFLPQDRQSVFIP